VVLRGADTRVCRVETHLDPFSAVSHAATLFLREPLACGTQRRASRLTETGSLFHQFTVSKFQAGLRGVIPFTRVASVSTDAPLAGVKDDKSGLTGNT
jgi:hypothetical protein